MQSDKLIYRCKECGYSDIRMVYTGEAIVEWDENAELVIVKGIKLSAKPDECQSCWNTDTFELWSLNMEREKRIGE